MMTNEESTGHGQIGRIVEKLNLLKTHLNLKTLVFLFNLFHSSGSKSYLFNFMRDLSQRFSGFCNIFVVDEIFFFFVFFKRADQRNFPTSGH